MKLLHALSISIAAAYATSATAQDRPPVEPIDWQPCGIESRPELECAVYAVPLSYRSKPLDDAKIHLQLVRQPATDPTQRKGSLLVNPGGPGLSGVDMVISFGQSPLLQSVQASYDLIGFDPRGVARSTPLGCLKKYEELAIYNLQPAFPMSMHEELETVGLDHYLTRACRDHASPIIHHMSTANVAHDMELLRQALGEGNLNFFGGSYGSVLGMTYANLYPDKVGAFVLVGVQDPVAWSTGRGIESLFLPVSTRLGRDASSMATLGEFFRTCNEAGPERCALAGSAAERYASILKRLEREPVDVLLPNGAVMSIRYQDVIARTASDLSFISNWPALAEALAIVESALAGEQLRPLPLPPTPSEIPTEAPAIPPDNLKVANLAVMCSDSDNPVVPFIWPLAGIYAEQTTGYFGRFWTWLSSPCSSWPGSKSERYVGPYDKPTANTILLVNTLFDPATGYEGAASAANTLANARLLTIDGWAHTSVGLSRCADQHITDYFLRNALPEEGTVCEQDLLPFPSFVNEDKDGQLEVRALSVHAAEDVGAESEKERWLEAKEQRENLLRQILPPSPLIPLK